jgi:hypothetical protein
MQYIAMYVSDLQTGFGLVNRFIGYSQVVITINCKTLLKICFHWLYSPPGPWPLIFSFIIILQTVGLLGLVISSSQGLYLNTGQHKHRINTYQTSMPCVGFEPTIPALERVKAVHALDSPATVTGLLKITEIIYLWFYSPCGPCPLFQFLVLLHSR